MEDISIMKKAIADYIKGEYMEEDAELSDDTKLISSGIVDSFSMVSLKRFLEKRYSISIPDDKATPETFDSVNGICALVQQFVK